MEDVRMQTILLVEDDEKLRNEVEIFLNNNGYQVEETNKSMIENVILYIKDNGIGIKKGEIARVFEKGFTGTNGRLANKKSTGIGLYLCKNLCNKLGIMIELNSTEQEGTQIRLIFPRNSYVCCISDM